MKCNNYFQITLTHQTPLLALSTYIIREQFYIEPRHINIFRNILYEILKLKL